MSSLVSPRYVTVRCDGCGAERELSERQARRPGRCEMCRRMDRVSFTTVELCWWLEALSDEALADVLTHTADREITVQSVRALRVAVYARPVRGLSSVSEQAGLVEA